VPATCAIPKVGEKRVSLSFRECAYLLEVLKRRLHKPGIKSIEILCDLNFGPDDDVIESKVAKLSWQVPYDERISQFPAGEVAEPAR